MWISFDLDGTILDWPTGRVVFKRLREEFGNEALNDAIRAEYRTRFASQNPVSAFDWDELHDAVTTRLGLEMLPRVLDLAEQGDWTMDGLVYADTKPALTRLEAMGFKILVGTNGFAKYQKIALEKLGVDVRHILAPDTIGYCKPQAEFLTDFHRLEPDGQIHVHVGDLLAQDIMAANRAGITGAWVWRDMPSLMREIPVSKRSQHPAILEQIAAQFEEELERDGRFGAEYEHTPRPDIVVADLL
ncbi:MAG: HAD family hydrolase, partial [Pleurocapsa sp. SU_196_0]|nr:HAD family hydrolase [Pleurocapsa sp. SU_196_0]